MKDKGQLDPNDLAWLGDLDGPASPDALTAALDLAYAEGPDGPGSNMAHARLRQTLNDKLGPVVYYSEIPESPVGKIIVAVARERVVAVDFGVELDEFLLRIRKRGYRRFLPSQERTMAACLQVQGYLDGELAEFDLESDLSGLTDFQKEVLLAAMSIPRGQVKTYGQIARSLGRPQSSRAVGRALGSNPIPLVIPCHRVIGSDGSLRGYSGGGGVRSKAFLLKLEGAQLAFQS